VTAFRLNAAPTRPSSRLPASAFLIVALAVLGSRVPAAAQDAPAPEIAVSLRGVSDGIVEQGQPMRVAVQLRFDDSGGQTGRIVLAPATGSWADAIDVAIVDAAGNPVGQPAHVVGEPDDPVATVDPEQIAGGLWRFGPEGTRSLAPGMYALRARLAIAAAAPGSAGWTGQVLSQDLPLQIVAPSNQPERMGERALAEAEDALAGGRLQEAAARLDALLGQRRDNLRAWTVRAVVSERAGNIVGALQSVDEAHRLYDALGIDEPYLELQAIQQRLVAALTGPSAAATASAVPPDWSWPPAGLLSPNSQGPPTPPGAPAPPVPPSPPTPPAAAGPAPAGRPAESQPPPRVADVTPAAVGAADAANTTPASPQAAAVAPAPAVESATVIDFAGIDEARVLGDPRGQWAAGATASSEYGNDRYNARQATGAPNVASYSDNPNAWCHSGRSVAEEWLEVSFARSVRATELRVRQTFTPGTIGKVEAFGADGRAQVLWQGTDPNAYPANRIAWFVLRFPAPPFAVDRVRLTLNIGAKAGWKQIDAVQLVGDAP
jgi:hypothetical protein